MLTYTQMYKEAADLCGVSTSTAPTSITNIQRHINLALKNFKNGSRRYWTRKEVTTNLVSGQQYYTFPVDMIRITAAKITSGSLTPPIIMIDSEDMWNKINLIPAMTVGIPIYGFIRGRNELGLYPIPSTNYTNGLTVSYESRMRDMTIDDTTSIAVTVTQNSNIIVATSGSFNANMVGMTINITDASGDGNWYLISGYTDTTHVTIENYYQGATVTGVASIIAFVPDIPEDFHQALIDYACYRYFLKRKDTATSSDYKSLYDQAMMQYISRYANKTTGLVQDDLSDFQFNIFNLPPSSFSI